MSGAKVRSRTSFGARKDQITGTLTAICDKFSITDIEAHDEKLQPGRTAR